MSTPPTWTEDRVTQAIIARASQLGIEPGEIAPSSLDLGTRLVNGAVRCFGTLGAAQVAAGYRVAPRGYKSGRLRRRLKSTSDPEKVVVFDPPAGALTPAELAAERAASLERQRKAREAEPAHRPLPYTGKERSRMWRVRSVEEEWDEDRKAMEAEMVA